LDLPAPNLPPLPPLPPLPACRINKVNMGCNLEERAYKELPSVIDEV